MPRSAHPKVAERPTPAIGLEWSTWHCDGHVIRAFIMLSFLLTPGYFMTKKLHDLQRDILAQTDRYDGLTLTLH